MALTSLNYIFCSGFIIIPLLTSIIGTWIIFHNGSMQKNKMSGPILISIVFFEASILGMFADPRSEAMGIIRIFSISALIGIVVFILVLVLGPLFTKLIRYFQ